MLKLQGSITALATPFRGGAVDEKAYEHFVDWQIREGTNGLVVCGTTGEAPTLSKKEQDRLIEITVKVAAKRVPVLAGTGSNNTAHVIERTNQAVKLGVDGALIVTPYYNKPTQDGLYQHFKAVHDATQASILLYNIPPRCVVDILPPTMKKLSELPRVIGVKDATGDLGRPVRTRADCGNDFTILAGDDALALAFNAQGATGCVSVGSNVAPRLYSDMQKAWAAGDRAAAEALRDRLAPLNQALFMETSPSPLKYAMSLLGLGTEEVRLPLVTCQSATKAQMEQVLATLGLLKAKAA